LGHGFFLDRPFLIFAVSLLALVAAAFMGASGRRRFFPLRNDEEQEYNLVQGASLTLLGLLVGFTFSLAATRYDLRKTLEESEANAIGTEFLRADLLPDAAAAATREGLKDYLAERIAFFSESDPARIARIDAETARLQANLWSLVGSAGAEHPTAIMALTVSGMNDVLNAQGFTQAAFLNRIPTPAWVLMALIALGCNLLLGYGAKRVNSAIFFVVPLTISVSFLLIADIDSPRGGVIRVAPQNLLSLSHSLDAR
jgi:hypothetical protein